MCTRCVIRSLAVEASRWSVVGWIVATDVRRDDGTVGDGCGVRSFRVGEGAVVVDDLTLTRIGEAVQLHHHRGKRDAARDVFAQIWADIGGEDGDPLHVCVLAHSMADVQDDVEHELAWDLRALAAADLVTDERTGDAGVALPAAGLYPSLHLNVSECYLKLGDPDRAREHLQQARATIGALGDDEYGSSSKTA